MRNLPLTIVALMTLGGIMLIAANGDGNGAAKLTPLGSFTSGDVPTALSIDDSNLAAQDAPRQPVPPIEATKRQQQQGTPSNRRVDSENQARTPLDDVLEDRYAQKLSLAKTTLMSQSLSAGERLNAASSILRISIALNMELAGTALPTGRPGQAIELPAPLRFTRNERQYCFQDGEFPSWDTYQYLQSVLLSQQMKELPLDFVQQVAALADDARLAVLSN